MKGVLLNNTNALNSALNGAAMPSRRRRESLEDIVRQMGEPSWLVLAVLEPTNPIAAIEIIRRVEQLLAEADYPYKRLDPSTLHHSLSRMIEDGLVLHAGQQEVDVPVGHGATKRDI